MVVPQHALVCPQVELVIVLCELSVADRGVFVYYASNFHHAIPTHPVRVALEFNDFDLRIYLTKLKCV